MKNQLIKIKKRDRLYVSLAKNFRSVSLYNQTLFNLLISSGLGDKLSNKLSVIAAAIQLEKSYDDVPGYKDFVDRHQIKFISDNYEDFIASIPFTDKKNYIDRYSIAQRCVGGMIPLRDAEIDESSGSSGKPYSWIRGHKELEILRKTLSRLATYMYGPDIVTINGFSMGAWATGTNVSMALVRNGIIKSTGPDAEKMLSVFKMLGPGRTYVVTGYPPFLLELIEYGINNGLNWSEYNLIGIVGGEAMSETLRSELLKHFHTITSAYGASDLDIGVASEFPLSTWIRQKAALNPDLATELFGDARRLPMLFQYDPLDYYVEQNKKGELIVTVNRTAALSPRLRYNVHDIGGHLDFNWVLSVCKKYGLDPLREAPLPYSGKHSKLPFLYIGGRSDSTISYLGANIYPEDVEQGIFGDVPATEERKIKGFAMELVEDNTGQPRPVIYVELNENIETKAIDKKDLQRRIINRLSLNSRDFKTSLKEDPKAGDIEVKVYKIGEGPFTGMKDRIKRKYIINTKKEDGNVKPK